MKRCFALLLAMTLLFSGCGKKDAPVTEEPEQTTPPVTTPAPEPFVQYQEKHSIEVLTDGAVQSYRIQGEDYYGMVPVSGGILLLSGEKETTLTRLTPDGTAVQYTTSGCHLDTDTLWDTALGLSYYDAEKHSLVFLDDALKESLRISMPEDMTDPPVMSQDGQLVYYYNTESLRCLEVRTGIARLLKESRFEKQQVQKLHFAGELLECFVSDAAGDRTLFVSTQTGETLFIAQTPVEFRSQGQEYFACWYEGEVELHLFGTRGDTIQRLTPPEEGTYRPLFGSDMLVSYTTDSTGLNMICYDQENGNRLSRVRLSGFGEPSGMVAGDGKIWFLSRNLFTNTDALYSWDPSTTMEELENSFLSPYYTAQSPDKESLKQLQEQADELAKTHGVRIELWRDAAKTLPDEYSVTTEYLVNVYETYLPVLEKALSAVPKTVYQKLGKQSQNGKLTISLVREIYGPNELGRLTAEDGVHFWSNGSSYLLLRMNDKLERSFYHELFHAMDSYILTETKAYDNWQELNPAGFNYDFSYITNEDRDPGNYLDDATRAFIDIYAMSYPKEDRARIMEYAMLEGNEAYFATETMANKLETLCKGIRKAFKLDEGDYLWEQYL